MNRLEIDTTYSIIKMIIDRLLEAKNVTYVAQKDAPSTYKYMRLVRETTNMFVVFDGGDHGILGKEYNIKFRALHDSMHYDYNLSFKFDDERELSRLTCIEFRNEALALGCNKHEADNVAKIIDAEIRGQIDYYVKHGKYVEDQTKFIYKQLGA